jgi:DNA helicase-2/ATP-dependent DNA helicase PcrA
VSLLTEATQWQLALRVVRNARGPFEHVPWTTPFVARYVIALAGELSEHLADPDDVRAVDAKVAAEIDGLARSVKDVREIAERARSRDELLTLVEAYTTAKEELDLLDYGDQVALAARIADVAPVVAQLERSRFSLVVLDEYQDTGVAQRQLLSRLFGGGHAVTAVGDPNQAIYGWRGSARRPRSASSPAALLVNVRPSTAPGESPWNATACTTRAAMTIVLPEPAPATTSCGSSGWVAIVSWSSVKSTSSSSRR